MLEQRINLQSTVKISLKLDSNKQEAANEFFLTNHEVLIVLIQLLAK